ncbi:ATP-binding protein [Conexibacter sp. SYSU D00693]|uniref:hybrid sensor histidine kinase/response regulator n=1 Tax=Conexibacter sp. SYSU D00693 TaxID=2812560 RepID=UPI00196A9927|nr:ATP-binding protein [Conexibacter sp. SYSU D00693]
MRRAPSIRGLLAGLLAMVVVMALALSGVTVLQMRVATDRTAAERQRVTSFRLADQMRQSSNDLTRMVRLYVTTGEERYRRFYDEILEIRSGTAPRPQHYDSSFWDRVLADGEAGVRRGAPASLTELMRRAHFAPEEFSALAASLRASNELAELEVRVMDELARRDPPRGSPLRTRAYERMVDDHYHAEKGRIMAAIDRFTELVDARTARRAEQLQARTDRLLVAQTAVLVVLLAVLIATLAVVGRAVVRPLSRLADVTRRITHGDWSGRARPEGVRELAQLAGDFNEMADTVERDLARRRRAEREAREAEHRLQTIADRVPGAVFQFHVDPVGAFSVRFASRHGSIHRLDGNQDVDFPGMSRAVLPEDRGPWLDSMIAAARSGGSWQREYRIRTPDGDVAWMEGHAVAVRGADGSAELYGYVADVTERKALETELRRAREEAESADRAKSAFLAMMSHELRTPLVAVTGTLEILALDDLDLRQRDLVDTAMGSARTLLAVIGDVLDFSKIEAGALDLLPRDADVGALVRDVAAQHRHAAAARGLAIEAEVDAGLAPAHVVDAARLRQVLGNLVGNAIKFTREGGVTVRVVVRGTHDGLQDLVFEVQDSGIGIAPADQQRLFVPFVQASTQHARASDGTGLGLAICRQLVEAMGGSVALSSTPGVGTTVRVALALPAGDARAAHAGDTPGAGEPEGRRALPAREAALDEGSLLLLVEDHPVNRRVLAGQLEAIGFRVDAAADAEEALARFGATRYGLVFTDIQLPHVDGYQLARLLRATERQDGRPRTPVLALTASALQGERERCREAGMDDVVTKPATVTALAATLRRWLPHVPWSEPGPVPVAPPVAPDLDASALHELTAGDEDLAGRVLADYAEAVRQDLAELRAALVVPDPEAVRRSAHRVAGASRTVGAWAVADAAAALERAVDDDAEPDRLAALAAELEDRVAGRLAAGPSYSV